MNCPNCHRHMDDHDSFCMYCGAALKPESGPKVPKSKKIIRWILISLICCIILAFGARILVLRIKSQQVTQELLDHLVDTTDNTAMLVEDYFDLYFSYQDRNLALSDLSDYYTKLEMAENKIVRESIYLNQVYNGCIRRKGWDSHEYKNYEALYDACMALIDFTDDYDSDDPFGTREEYDALMKAYQKRYNRVD